MPSVPSDPFPHPQPAPPRQAVLDDERAAHRTALQRVATLQQQLDALLRLRWVQNLNQLIICSC